jgi:hypothetical protein
MKIRPVEAVLFHADRRTDITKPIVTSRNFANAAIFRNDTAISEIYTRFAGYYDRTNEVLSAHRELQRSTLLLARNVIPHLTARTRNSPENV